MHAPIQRGGQEWWTDGDSRRQDIAPLFQDYERVYGAGQFTWAGLRTVTGPPTVAHSALVDAWELHGRPVGRWLPPVPDEARVCEMHRPGDWVRLVTDHPRTATPANESWELPGVNQDRTDLSVLLARPKQHAARRRTRQHLVPDWRSVATEFDGIHLSWAGLITTEGFVSDLDGGDVAMLRYWFSERTLWLRDVFDEPRPLSAPALTEHDDTISTVEHGDHGSSLLRTFRGR